MNTSLSPKLLIILTAIISIPIGAALGYATHHWRSETFHTNSRLERVYRHYADNVGRDIKMLRYLRENEEEKLMKYLEISLGVSYGLMTGTGRDFPEVFNTSSSVQRAITKMKQYRKDYPKE